jgi:hypothetical protein
VKCHQRCVRSIRQQNECCYKAYQSKINSLVLDVVSGLLALKTLKYFWSRKILDQKYINIFYTLMNHKM